MLGSTLALAACSPDPIEYGSVAPATAEQKAEFGRDATDRIDYATDLPVVEYFCVNTIGSACPADIEERLASYYTTSQRTRVDVADAFARYRATIDLGDPEALISDEDYVEAAYQVTFGRELDPSGRASNLGFVLETGQRKAMLRTLLESQEFAS